MLARESSFRQTSFSSLDARCLIPPYHWLYIRQKVFCWTCCHQQVRYHLSPLQRLQAPRLRPTLNWRSLWNHLRHNYWFASLRSGVSVLIAQLGYRLYLRKLPHSWSAMGLKPAQHCMVGAYRWIHPLLGCLALGLSNALPVVLNHQADSHSRFLTSWIGPWPRHFRPFNEVFQISTWQERFGLNYRWPLIRSCCAQDLDSGLSCSLLQAMLPQWMKTQLHHSSSC